MQSIDLIRENLKRSEDSVLRASTVSLLESLTEEDLDRASANAPSGVEGLFGTYRRCLQYSADHWFMHLGQLADARRAAGLERAWF